MSGRTTIEPERQLRGVGVSPGVSVGPAYLRDRGSLRVPEYAISPDAAAAECARFNAAVEEARRQLSELREKATRLSGAAAEEFGYLLDAHFHMLAGSRLIRSVHNVISSELVNSEAAIVISLEQIEDDFREIDDPYIAARIADVREVAGRLLRNLTGGFDAGFEHVPCGAVVIGDEISPADAALMDPERIGGFATATGGAEGHTAIMARSLGLPAVLGIPELTTEVRSGDMVIIDGSEGLVVVNPTAETLERYADKRRAYAADQVALAALKGLPAESADGVTFTLQANMELPAEIESVLAVGASGVGLLRSEFMFMNRKDLPSEEEQYRVLRSLLKGMNGAPVTVRTLDVGADKLSSALGVYGTDPNPALGLRAIRFSLKMRPLFESQLCAMLRAAAHGPLRILVPMIGTADEVRLVREILQDMARRLRRRGEDIPDPLPPLGVMIEVPAAALAADALAEVSDFFSIGTNDLTMYTLAIDRGNEQVAHLYDPLHPAVLRLLQFTTQAARHAGIPVNLCGEMAGDERFTAFLAGLGLRDLSMAPLALPRIKRRIRVMHCGEAKELADSIMRHSDQAEISRLLRAFNQQLDARISTAADAE